MRNTTGFCQIPNDEYPKFTLFKHQSPEYNLLNSSKFVIGQKSTIFSWRSSDSSSCSHLRRVLQSRVKDGNYLHTVCPKRWQLSAKKMNQYTCKWRNIHVTIRSEHIHRKGQYPAPQIKLYTISNLWAGFEQSSFFKMNSVEFVWPI